MLHASGEVMFVGDGMIEMQNMVWDTEMNKISYHVTTEIEV